MLSPSSTIPAAHPTTYMSRGERIPRDSSSTTISQPSPNPTTPSTPRTAARSVCRVSPISSVPIQNAEQSSFLLFPTRSSIPWAGHCTAFAHPQKRTLLFAEYLDEQLLLNLPHRQFHFFIPKALRIFFLIEICTTLHYMDEIAVRDLQHRMREVLESAVSGATVVIKKRGKPIARYQAAAKMTDKKTDFDALIVANCEADDRNLRMALIPFFGIAFKPRTPSRMPARSKTIRWAHPSSGTMTGSSATDTGR